MKITIRKRQLLRIVTCKFTQLSTATIRKTHVLSTKHGQEDRR